MGKGWDWSDRRFVFIVCLASAVAAPEDLQVDNMTNAWNTGGTPADFTDDVIHFTGLFNI